MNHNDIPPMQRPEDIPAIHTQADLERFWRMVKGPWGFDEPQLWALVIAGDDRPTGALFNFAELPREPNDEALANLLGGCRQVMAEMPGEPSVALLYARPGNQDLGDADVTWARAINRAAQQAGVATRPVHFANDALVRVFSPDDLGLGRSVA